MNRVVFEEVQGAETVSPDQYLAIDDALTELERHDSQAGQPNGPYVAQPNHIRSIREERYKLAKYFDPDGNEAEQWEMYDLAEDPLETVNIANPDFSRTAEQEQELQRLTAKLVEVEATRLLPLPNTPQAATPTAGTPEAGTPVAVAVA